MKIIDNIQIQIEELIKNNNSKLIYFKGQLIYVPAKIIK